MTTSLIYSNIHIYRSAMNLLYAGKYRQRFADVIDQIGPETRSLCDLCFGDTIIADWCRDHRIAWTGIDLNPYFCERARKQGHRAMVGDLFSVDLPTADVFVMVGSLYHFHDRLPELFDLVWNRTRRLILSEPVRNLSSRPGLIGAWARRSANPGDGDAAFRYVEDTLLDALRRQQARLGFDLRVASVGRDMVVTISG